MQNYYFKLNEHSINLLFLLKPSAKTKMKLTKYLPAFLAACFPYFPAKAGSKYITDPSPSLQNTRKAVFIVMEGRSADMTENPTLTPLPDQADITAHTLAMKRAGIPGPRPFRPWDTSACPPAPSTSLSRKLL